MLPNNYTKKMKELLKDEYSLYEHSFNHPCYKGLRVNTLKISVNDFLTVFPYKLEPIPWTSDGFYYEDESINKHPFYYAGLYYLQEPSAMLPAEILPINENDLVLDTCAAPGGKSSKLAVKLNNSGLLFSNDISYSRQEATLRNLERFGVRNATVTSATVKDYSIAYPNYFDSIIVDAPCSGEGMFRKDPHLITSWLEKGPDYYSNIQKEIITDAINCLKPGGHLVYSTCTFDSREDEEVIKYALDNFDIEVLPIKQHEGFVSSEYGTKLFPHKIKGEGHFVSLLKKNGNKQINNEPILINKPDLLKDYNIKFTNGEFTNINNNLYFSHNIKQKGIRILRSGLLIGEIKNNELIPSQAFAMSLNINEYDNRINLDYNDPRVIKYLKGETINLNEYPNTGNVLITVNNYPLGFAKINNSIFKNKIDKGWIYR